MVTSLHFKSDLEKENVIKALTARIGNIKETIRIICENNPNDTNDPYIEKLNNDVLCIRGILKRL